MAIPLSLIPVSLKESALDSPTFRASAIHLCEQVDAVEKWLESYVRSTLKVCQEIGALEEALSVNFSNSMPNSISETIIDPDYTSLAIDLFAQAGRDFWSIAIAYSKRLQPQIIDPLSEFLRNDVRLFKDCRRAFESSQQRYDLLLQRYAGQSKGKEASALREDAFQLHESRKNYIRSSFDFCVKAPELRASLDRLITKVTTDVWREQVRYRKGFVLSLDHYENKMDRIRSWSDSMETSSRIFKQELALARKDMEEQARSVSKPSRELDDYSTSTVPFLTTRGREIASISTSKDNEALAEKQGWLFIRSATGKQGARSVWVRRWCFVKDGMFGSLVLQMYSPKGAGVEETEKIGLLLCNVKPAFQEDRRFCFEIKTKDTNVLLQAETQQELTTWLHVFEAAKRAALVSSSSTTTLNTPAFAISPPNADFASTQTLRLDELDKPTGLNISNSDTVARVSTDMSKRVLPTIDDTSLSTHNSRLGQILDLPTRRNTSVGMSPSATGERKVSSGGIQALISASHGALPLNPVPPASSTNPNPSISYANHVKYVGSADGGSPALGPRTLVNLPMSTNLSRQAVAVSASSDQNAMVPGGLMANSWGTSNWGMSGRQDDIHPKNIEGSENKTTIKAGDIGTRAVPSSGTGHKKAVSLDLESQLSQPAIQSHIVNKTDNYPNNYPDELRQQDAQFRIIFSEVGREEIVLLVFCATWKPNDAQEFPGRAFVTSNALYFYSHHLGLVLVNTIPLRYITDVQAVSGKNSDLIYLHLKEVEELGALSDEDIAVTVFLEPVWSLQRRLRYLVEATTFSAPLSSFELITALTNMENEPQRSPASESWEEISIGEGLEESASKSNQTAGVGSMRRLVERVTRTEFVDSGRHRFNIVDPVALVPPADAHNVFDQVYTLSAKSLFSLIFGGKSNVFPELYSRRRSAGVKCGPWLKASDNFGHRTFYYTDKNGNSRSEDCQTINAWEDNRYYVVVDRKQPWTLPNPKCANLEISIIISQVTKTTSRLSIWIAVRWLKQPIFWKDSLQNYGMQLLRHDAQDLASIISHEISRAGSGAKLFKITGEYGQVIVKEAHGMPEVPETGPFLSPTTQIPEITYWSILIDRLAVITAKFVDTLLRGFEYSFRRIYGYIRLNWIVLVLLAISIIFNMSVSLRAAKEVWHDMAALSYIEKIGVVPANILTRSLTLDELELVMSFQAPHIQAKNNPCFQKFLDVYALVDNHQFTNIVRTGSNSQPSFQEGLQAARNKLGTYRHDVLVALSLINRLEKDILLSEWETWVWREKSRCYQGKATLLKSTYFESTEQERRSNALEMYCSSCQADLFH